MFLKTSRFNSSQDRTPTLALPSPPQASSAPRSLISADIVVNGDIVAVGEIQIDGTITGNLRASQVTVGRTATIRGDIVADEIVVRGHVIGSITGRRVQLSGTSYVEGDIRHESMGMEMGARLDGCCRHMADPLTLAAPAPAALPKPMSLARAALRTEERSVALAAPALDTKPAEAAAAPAPVPAASESTDASAPVENDLDVLKSAGLEMRAKVSKTTSPSAKKPAASKATGRKPLSLAAAASAEAKTAAPSLLSRPFADAPSEAEPQIETSAAPETVEQSAAVNS